jgi:hypothetical protein
MGLDMYAYRVGKEHVVNDFEFNSDQDGANDIAYWRKFNALHGWMERLYRERGGPKESFNCAPLRLHLEDLDQLQRDIGENKLEPTEGFFFGSQTIYPEDVASAMKFIFEAREIIKQGDAVYYDSWW